MPAPASLQVTLSEKKYLKLLIENEYGIKIIDTPSCKELSELIFSKLKITISYSTIRRFFDLLPNNTHAPSMYTLNSIVKLIDFRDWITFKEFQNKYDTNRIHQNIQIYFNQIKDTDDLIFDTVKNISLHQWNGGYQLQNIILLAIEKNDFQLLTKIISLPYETENSSVYECLVMAFQAFYFQSVKNNQHVIDFIKNNIGKSIVLQKCLLQAYVDERYLNGFIGEWLEVHYEEEVEDLCLFKNLLLCEKSYLNRNQADADFFYKKGLEFSNDKNKIHPILWARISAWELILYNTEKYLLEYYDTLENPFDKADFLVIYSRLIWTYKQNDYVIAILEEVKIDEFPLVKDFFQKGRYNVLLITMAMNSFLKKDFQKFRELFTLYDPNILGYDIVNADFYRKLVDFF